jgi:predicted HTH transcriptional regulator
MILVGIMINLNPLYLEIQNNEVLRTIAANLSGSIDKLGGAIGGAIEDLGGAIEVSQLTERQQEILVLIRANPKVSYRSLAEQLDINQSALQKHLNHLKDAGWLERMGGTRGYWAIKKELNLMVKGVQE